MIQLRNVYKKYKDNYALQNINLDIMASEFVFLTGSSGAGYYMYLWLACGRHVCHACTCV